MPLAGRLPLRLSEGNQFSFAHLFGKDEAGHAGSRFPDTPWPMKTTKNHLLALALCLSVLAPAHAFNLRPDGVSVFAGGGSHGSAIAGGSLLWDWDFERMRRKAELTAHTELIFNEWRASAVGGGNAYYAQVALLPTLRMRLKRGQSPWYIELGIGISYLDKHFQTPQKEFSTRWNFYDVMGLGYTLDGPDGKHEINARWLHVSNGGLEKPNPGQDFLQLRYVKRF